MLNTDYRTDPSLPLTDNLEYITLKEVEFFLTEIKENFSSVTNIGLTGGEPFINPNIIPIINITFNLY